MPKFILLVALLAASQLSGQNSLAERAAWNKPVRPFRIVGNIYYVGAQGVSSFLIVTSQGNILLDGAFAETAPLIEKNISNLGFRLADVKILLSSHAHWDHCGGLTELKKLTHATTASSLADTVEANGHRQLACHDPDRRIEPVEVDRIVSDGDTIQLGGTTLTAHLTPGHTRGCTTWTMPVTEDGTVHRALFSCSVTVAQNRLVGNTEYPQIVADYQRTFQILRGLQCDVFLAPHPGFFNMEQKLACERKGVKQPFVNAGELQQYLNDSERDFQHELAKQKAAMNIK